MPEMNETIDEHLKRTAEKRKHWSVDVTFTVHAFDREEAEEAVDAALDGLTYDGLPLWNASRILESTAEAGGEDRCAFCFDATEEAAAVTE